MKDALGHGSNAHGAGIAAAVPAHGRTPADLRLFADNDRRLYDTSKRPIEQNLEKKIDKGVYDHTQATKLWGYHADRAAQAMHREFGTESSGLKWHQAFPPGVRQATARGWADSFRADHQSQIAAARVKYADRNLGAKLTKGGFFGKTK